MRYMITFLLLLSSALSQTDLIKKLNKLTRFRFVSEQIASSGMLKLEDYAQIKEYGFKHVINLLPGNQIKEKSHVKSLGMSYKQIKVSWMKPTLSDFKTFVKLMKSYGEDKVYIHCAVNMRASSFVYLYRVTQLKEEKKNAKKDLDFVWYPEDQWKDYIENTLKAYGYDPEYRFESSFIKLIRTKGVDAAYAFYKEQSSTPFTEVELNRIASELNKNETVKDAYKLYKMLVDAFPNSVKGLNELSELHEEFKHTLDVIKTRKQLIQLNSEDLWSKRILGKMGEKSYQKYWNGTNNQLPSKYLGKYTLHGTTSEIVKKNNDLYFIAGWNKKEYKMYSDAETQFFLHERKFLFNFSTENNMPTISVLMGDHTMKTTRLN